MKDYLKSWEEDYYSKHPKDIEESSQPKKTIRKSVKKSESKSRSKSRSSSVQKQAEKCEKHDKHEKKRDISVDRDEPKEVSDEEGDKNSYKPGRLSK